MFKEVACAVLRGAGSVLSGTWIMLGPWLCQSRSSSSSSAGTSRHLQETNTAHTYSEKQFQTPRGKVKEARTNTEPDWSGVREQVTKTFLYFNHMIMALQAHVDIPPWYMLTHLSPQSLSRTTTTVTHCCWRAIRWGLSLWAAPPAPWGQSPPHGFLWTRAPSTASSLLPGASSHSASSSTSCRRTQEKRRRVKELWKTRWGQ